MTGKKNADGGQPSAGNAGLELGGSNPHFTTNGTHDQTPNSASMAADAAAQLAAVGLRTHGQLEAEQALLTQGLHDEGIAQCVALRYPNRFARNAAYGWLYNTGSHWITEGAEEKLYRAIVDTLQARIQAALDSGQADKYGALIKYCVPSNARVQGAKANLSALLFTPLETFDSDPNLLNCINGVIDLRNGTIRPHQIGDHFLYCVPTEYKPDADQSVWKKWLTETLGPEAANWLQLASGYSLTGHTTEEIMLYLYGPSRAGKGLITETIGAMLGQPTAKEVNFSTFTAARSGDSQNFDLAPLKPCRIVMASESNAHERFNEAKVKALTGGNEVYCAFKHRDHFSYKPEFKIWLSSNQPVNADPDDDAVWGRLRIVEFRRSHLGQEDKTLKPRMKSPAVLRGVLAWAVAGARLWYALGNSGLPELEASVRVKALHRAELDHVGAWLEECCSAGFDDLVTANSMLYLSYESWCQKNGVTPKQQKGLSQALKRKGYRPTTKTVKVDGKVIRGFYGINIGE